MFLRYNYEFIEIEWKFLRLFNKLGYINFKGNFKEIIVWMGVIF